ncbi:MAG: TolC family protein [Desulfobacterales bacterium]
MTIRPRPVHRSSVLLVFSLAVLSFSCAVHGSDPPVSLPQAVAPSVGPSPTAEADPRSPGAVPDPEQPLRLTLHDAILMSLENNRSLAVERLTPSIQETFTAEERAVFDPVLEGEASYLETESQRLARSGSDTESLESKVTDGRLSLVQFFPTGTFVEAEAATTSTDSSLYQDPFTSTRLGLVVTQSLLRGLGTDVNLARLRQARLETRISLYELRGFTESLMARVENAYWDYALAIRQIEIVEESLRVANQQLDETREMIEVGTMAEAELAAVQAEVAAQQQALINARSSRETARLELLRLLNPPVEDLWQRQVVLVHPPELPDVQLGDVSTHVAAAERMRPEINQTKLNIRQGDLEIVRTRNGLLPKMDLFVQLGKTGYADSFSRSVDDISNDNYDVQAGVAFEFPPLNRSARAEHRRSLLSRDQSERALDNLSQLVELDVRTAFIEVDRSREQIDASSATRRYQEETLRIETEKFRVGRSTNFFVAQAQRDLLVARINEVEAVVSYLKALTDFYRLEGSLLERRGIDAPGAEPVSESEHPVRRYNGS